MPRLADQIREAVEAFAALHTPPALIGGLALAAHRVVRATRGVDFLVHSEDADRLHDAISALGYRCVHRSVDAANYVRGDEGLEVLFARRPEALALLAGADVRETPMGTLRVVDAEGLVGFKLQALANDPGRARDLDDIRALLRNNAASLDMDRVRRYFAIFERENLLDEILAVQDNE